MSTHPTAIAEFESCLARVYSLFGPPPDMKISEWAEKYRILPEGTSPRPGKLRLEKFQKEILDAPLEDNVHEIVVKKSTQLGVTDAIIFSYIGYHIHLDPKPMIYVQPTIENAKDKGKKVITPMINANPVLAERVLPATSRRGGNTLRLKHFPGGFLKLAGANSPNDLKSDPVPIIVYDEEDGYPDDAGKQGDPSEQGSRRTDSYHDYTIWHVSTPAKPKGFSTIETAFEESDQRYFHVPCPFCSHKQPLLWRDPETRAYNMIYQLDGGG